MVTENKQIFVRRGTSAAWSSANPTLAAGEPGFDTTLEKLKVGDGATAWNSHPFIGAGGSTSRGTYAARPAAGNSGNVYYCSDIDAVYLDNGSTWDRIAFGQGSNPLPEPPTTGWSTTTLGTATIAADKDGCLCTAPGIGASDSLKVRYRTLSPTSNYSAVFYIEQHIPQINFVMGGAMIGNGTAWIIFGYNYANALQLSVSSYTNQTTFSAHLIQTTANPWSLYKWFRIRDDGTNRYYELSTNGLEWMPVYSQGRTTTLTPTVIGFGVNPNVASTSTCYARLRALSGVS